MWIVAIVFSLFITTSETVVINAKCPVFKDTNFHGYFMNCSNQELTEQGLKGLYHDEVTTLDLSQNLLEHLPNSSLVRFSQLKWLICIRCGLTKLNMDSLKGLENLRALHLNHNSLRIKDGAFPNGMFKHVPLLEKLYIDSNGNNGTIDKYSDHIDIFQSLPQLTDLAIDSFESLNIHEEFSQFPNLRSLQIDCLNLAYVHNDSFKGFENSTIKEIELKGGIVYESNLGLDVFQYLPNVSYLSLNSLRIGNHNFLLMMKPLEGRNIETIRVSTLYSSLYSTLSVKFSDAFVTVQSMKYLGKICVKHFYWFDSALYSVEGDAFFSKAWCRCLESLVLQSDQVVTTSFSTIFKFVLYEKIKLVSFSVITDHLVNQFFTYGPGIDYLNNERNRFVTRTNEASSADHFNYLIPPNSRPLRKETDNERHGVLSSYTEERWQSYVAGIFCLIKNNLFFFPCKGDNVLLSGQSDFKGRPGFSATLRNENMNNISDNSFANADVRIPLPPTLKVIFLDGAHYLHIRISYRFSKNSVTTLVLSNSQRTVALRGKLRGLDCMSTINMQHTTLDMDVNFFESFKSLKNLNLRKTAITSDFLEKNCKEIVENIANLEILDIAENDLTILAPHTFHTSKKLKYLSLEKNRFTGIPFDLRHTPELELLDLRGNVFSELSREDRAAIDEHIKRVPNFTILLSDNILSCSCSVFPFIAWLRENQAHFEHDGNFTCLSEDGTFSYTAFHADIAGFWRQCNGQYYFLVSLIMLCALLAGYCALFLGMKRKTQIISFFMRVFVPGFHLKSRKDFSTDVFIGYADQDVDFVRNVLLGYLERAWHLRTFVHSRDLLTDPLMMTAALEDSWRCLILITDNFLSNYHYSYNIMKVAAFFVGPNNPKRVVLVVEERVQHRLPAYLLQVVDEDSILILPHLEGCLDAQAVDTLRARLLD